MSPVCAKNKIGLPFSKTVKDLKVYGQFVCLVTFRKAFPLTVWNPPWSNLSPLFALSIWRCPLNEHHSVLTFSPLLPEIKQPTAFQISQHLHPFPLDLCKLPHTFPKVTQAWIPAQHWEEHWLRSTSRRMEYPFVSTCMQVAPFAAALYFLLNPFLHAALFHTFYPFQILSHIFPRHFEI